MKTPGVHLLRSNEAFEPHQFEWQQLCERAGCDSLFHHPIWLKAAWSYPGKPFLLAALESTEGWSTALTLCPRFDTGGHLHFPARALTILPHLPMIYPSLPVAACVPGTETSEVARLLAAALDSLSWDALSFDYLSTDTDWLERGVRHLAAERGWHVESVESSDEAWMDFPQGPDAYWAQRSGPLKRKLHKAARELAGCAEITREDVALSSASFADCFETLRPAFECSWQKGAGLSPFDESRRSLNIRELEALFRDGRIFVPALRADGRIVAFEVWLRGGAEMFGIARGLDPAYASYSIGNQLIAWTLEETFRRGVTRLYLGPVNDQPHMSYKERWLTGRRPNHRLIVVRPRSPYGALHRLLAKHPRLLEVWRRARIAHFAREGFYVLRSLKRR